MVKKICDVLSTLILICLAVIAVLLVGPKFFGYDQYVVLSNSMSEVIPVKSLIFDKRTDANTTYQVGDIVTYSMGENSETMVTHQIIEIDEVNRTVTTKGTHNDVADGSAVSFDDIKGVYKFHIPQVGAIITEVRSKPMLAVAIISAVLAVVILLNFLPEALSSSENKEVAADNKKKLKSKKNRAKKTIDDEE